MKKIYLLLLCISSICFSQEETKIKQSIRDYFKLEREQIFVHLNKSQFISGEQIAFKGYVIQKSDRLPNLMTRNVNVILYNEKGEVVLQKLLYCDNSTFDNTLKISESVVSGRYYLQFYTLHMNNFIEDESFVQRIDISNRASLFQPNSTELVLDQVDINMNPEGGSLVSEINNTVGIHIQDALGKPIQVNEGVIRDAKGRQVATFFTTKLGYGKFDFVPKKGIGYTAEVKIQGKTLVQALPTATLNKMGMRVIFDSAGLKVALESNAANRNYFSHKKYVLVAQQNQKANTFPITIDSQGRAGITITSDLLFDGINCLRLIDESNQQVGERMVFLEKKATTIPKIGSYFISDSKASVKGVAPSAAVNFSVSVLPVGNAVNESKGSLLGTFCLNSFLEKPLDNTYVYFDPQNSTRINDIDLMLLNQAKSKYAWHNIQKGAQNEVFKSQNGLSLKGNVIANIKDFSKYKVILIDKRSNTISETLLLPNNDFVFDHYYLTESGTYHLELLKEDVPVKAVFNALPIGSDFKYLKTPFFLNSAFENPKSKKIQIVFAPLIDENAIKLKEVELMKKQVEIKKKEIENGVRIEKARYERDVKTRSLADQYMTNGYYLPNNQDYNRVTSQGYTTDFFNSQSWMYEVPGGFQNFLISDEFLDPSGFIKQQPLGKNGSVNSSGFTSKISLRKGFLNNVPYTNAFPLENNKKVFDALGLFSWTPTIVLNDAAFFEIPFTVQGHSEIQLVIEGLDANGEFISLKKSLPILPKNAIGMY